MSPKKNSRNFTLNDTHAQLLKNQIFTEISPGSIVKDFNTFLDYIQSTKVEATPSNDLVNQKHLEPLNQRMTNPRHIKMNRPTFHSYPNLEGLYLLLRSTGIIKIVSSQKEKVIKPNEEVLNVWRTLNSTEQYFSLFTTWLFRSEGQRY